MASKRGRLQGSHGVSIEPLNWPLSTRALDRTKPESKTTNSASIPLAFPETHSRNRAKENSFGNHGRNIVSLFHAHCIVLNRIERRLEPHQLPQRLIWSRNDLAARLGHASSVKDSGTTVSGGTTSTLYYYTVELYEHLDNSGSDEERSDDYPSRAKKEVWSNRRHKTRRGRCG